MAMTRQQACSIQAGYRELVPRKSLEVSGEKQMSMFYVIPYFIIFFYYSIFVVVVVVVACQVACHWSYISTLH